MLYEDTFIPVSRPTPPVQDTPFVETSTSYILVTQEPLIIQRPTVPEAPVVLPIYAPTPAYHPIQPLSYGNIIIGGQNVAQSITANVYDPAPINNVTPLPPLTTYAGVTPIYASKSDILSPGLWSEYPAISTIQGNGYDLIDINEGNFSTINVSTINAVTLDLDGQFLQAVAGELLLNGVPIATTANISSIADWSIYPAFSTIVCENTDIIDVRNISSAQGTFSSITANTVTAPLLSSLQLQTSTITANTVTAPLLSSLQLQTSTITANKVTAPLLSSLQLQTSSITANYVSSLYSRASTIGAYDYQVINGLNVGNITTDASATTLFYNGVALASGSSVGSNWYLYPAQTAVDFNSKLLSSVTAIQVPNSGAGGPDLTITTGGAGSGFLNVIGNADIGGSLTTDSFITQNHISASGNNFFGNTVIIGDGGIAGIPADVEINGSDLLGGPSALVVNGGVTLDGGTYHGASIGCLPVAGINTSRIDVLPAGIDVVSATFLSMNILGATNLVAGGAVAIGAGSYVTLEHGAGLGSNGIFVQNTAGNSNAKMIFTNGGDISGALFNNQTVREVNTNTLAVGRSAGSLTPGIGGLAVGIGAGANSLAPNATAIGNLTMNSGSEFGSVAVGREAGYGNLGANSIAIGYQASLAGGSLVSTIVMNATGAPLNPVNENALYVAPIRNVTQSNILGYDTATKEVSYFNYLSTFSISSIQNVSEISAPPGDDVSLTSDGTIGVTAGSNINLTTTPGTGNDIRLVAENGIFIQALNALLDIEGANTVKVQSGGVLDLNGSDATIQLGTAGTMVATTVNDMTFISSDSNINITADQSLNLTASNGDLTLTGANIQSTAFGAGSGQYLRINLNGTFYKIELLDDV